ncbi:histidine kinase [hydrothermal vent metagenome]|uniref:Histidine kinase n=1 Tax=hydrothermal vent metagenome TaxID=652676 RepID=A0A1W1C2H6_9ZZZZ
MDTIHIQRERFTKQKIDLMLHILSILIITIGLMTIIQLIEADYQQFKANLLFCFILVTGYIRLKQNNHLYKTVIRIVFLSAIIASLFLLYHHSDNPINFIWFSTIVYMIYYLFDRDEASYWIAIITIALIVLFFLDTKSLSLSVTDFLVWILNMVIILMISHWYASIEENSIKKLLHAQKKLSEEVNKKTEELKIRTKELELLNQDLEKRIQEEVHKNSEQEQMLFRQARYAQMGEILNMIAHQWRQPLNAIAMTNTGMLVGLKESQINRENLITKAKRTDGYIQHLSQTIDDFRNFFRIDREKSDLTLSEVVHDALELLNPILNSHNIDVTIKRSCSCTIYSYPNEVLNVTLNLLNNAKDALMQKEDNREIIIDMSHDHASEGRTFTYLEIRDNAGGIPEEIIEKIFDPYFTTKEKQGGTGLGLYMSKQIVEKHCQGKINVKNGEDGAIFKISFPTKKII